MGRQDDADLVVHFLPYSLRLLSSLYLIPDDCADLATVCTQPLVSA